MVVADSAPVIRTGLSVFFKDSDFEIVAAAGSGRETIQKTLEHLPDLLLMDYLFPDLSGSQLLNHLKHSAYKGIIAIYTEKDRSFYDDEEIPSDLLWFLKSMDRESLVETLGSVLNNQYLFSHDQSCILKQVEKKSIPFIPSDILTSREKQILFHIVHGLGNKEIAAILGLSKDTVKEYVSNILRKFNARDRTQAAVFALKNDIISL